MHEDVLAAAIGGNEAVALLSVEPLHRSRRHGIVFLSRASAISRALTQPVRSRFWEKLVSQARSSRQGQVVRPKSSMRQQIGDCRLLYKGWAIGACYRSYYMPR